MRSNATGESLSDTKENCLSIEITTHCNGSCLHCFSRAGISQPANLSPGIARMVIREGYETGYRQLHITGGEPLLYEGLYGILDYASDLGYQKISMNTNGKLLTRDVAKSLAGYDGLSISVSLEGPELFHNNMRGAGSYKLAVRGVEKALEAGIDLVIFTVAGKRLLAVLPRFVDEVYQQFSGIKYLTLIQLISPTEDGFALSEELLEPEDFLQLVRIVSLLNIYGHRTNVKNSPLARIASKLMAMPWVPPAYPLYRDGSLVVMANGSMRLSHSSRRSLGTYAPGMIHRVRSSRGYRRAVAPNRSVCPSCKYMVTCRENGMFQPSPRHLDTHPDVLYCQRVLEKVMGICELRRSCLCRKRVNLN